MLNQVDAQRCPRYRVGVSDDWTVRRMMRWMEDDFAGKGIQSARLDAELLLAHVLKMERITLYLDLERPLSAGELAAVREIVRRRREREPVAYILGERGFWGRMFAVSPAVLVPRPDTETLVERALEVLVPDGRVLDLCTGSGCIAVTLAAERPDAVVMATDISPEALEIALKNAEVLGGKVDFVEADLFAGIDSTFDLITANPPYVSEAELAGLDRDVAAYEPHLALVGGVSGFTFIESISAAVADRLRPAGVLLMEVGEGQAPRTSELLEAAGLAEVRVHRDLGGIDRVVEARKAGPKI